ncbi:MAG TPA: hypothetical protein VM328_03635 [Fimbriimonadaceae bacterium]|nr:hypothetical protein [Fimbriimonadaceae bacterium]
MKLVSSIALGLAVAGMIAGCGGSGSSTGLSGGRLSKQRVLELLTSGLKDGSVLRNSGTGRKPQTRHHEGGDGSFFYDDFMGLWIEWIQGDIDDYESPSGERYWVDHDKTQSAGHNLMWASDPNVFPLVLRNERKITWGEFAGEEEGDTYALNADDSGQSQGYGKYPGYGTFEYSGSWALNGFGEWKLKYTYADGTWHEHTYTSHDDLTTTWVIKTSVGVTFTLTFAEDYSGTGTIQGAGEGLPATMAWDHYGDGFITWSDGSQTPFNVNDLG